ncbi:MAG: thiamine-phosphate kinase [Pseudomonadota bacterium]
MAERDRIARYFAPLTIAEPGSFHLTDDAALLTPPPGQQLIITTDSVIQGIHVLDAASPAHYAQKLVRRNLSDLAAMGATPWRYSINLHSSTATDDAWFATFAATLAAEQAAFGMALIGGDSTSGGNIIHAGMTCIGLIAGAPLRRHGAQHGDDLYVSGTIGDAALALTLLQQKLPLADAFAQRYHAPEPRLALGHMLRSIATAALDVSDGLLVDTGQLCRASNVGATVIRDAVPLSAQAQKMLQQHAALWPVILNGGDDYELCFTAPVSARTTLANVAQELALPLTRIGTITTGTTVQLQDKNGAPVALDHAGWEYR